MANAKKPTNPRLMAPRGVMVYPKLNAADTKFKAEGEFGTKVRYDADREDVKAFIAALKPLHEKAIAKATETFEALPRKNRDAFKAKNITAPVVNPLFSEVYDEADEPTGQIEFKFSTPASAKVSKGKNAGRTYIKRPTVVDAKGKVLIKGTDFQWLNEVKPTPTLGATVFAKMGPAIWGGSEGKFNIEVSVDADGNPGYFVPSTALCGISLRLRGVQLLSLSSGSSDDMGFGVEDGYEGEEASDDVEVNESAESTEDESADVDADASSDF